MHTALNLPASYAINVALSDATEVPGQASFFYVMNGHATDVQTLTFKTRMPLAGGQLYTATIDVPPASTLPVYVRANYFMDTGSGADITVLACFN